MYQTRIHESTISRIVPEVCYFIYQRLKNPYMITPKTTEEWKEVAHEFQKLWQFPNCLGALDGKHISFRAPISAGSYYYNYKGYNSIVLLGLADANYKLIYTNVGINGRISDGGVFRESLLGKSIGSENPLNFPDPEAPIGSQEMLPYVIIADDAFPLSSRLLKPYPERGLTHDKRIFNYRLSRGRRVVENAFGIMANRFRVLLNPINLSVEKVEIITLAIVALHNFLITENGAYTEMTPDESNENLVSVSQHMRNRSTVEALRIRDSFRDYFTSPSGAVSWQDTAVRGDYFCE